MAFTTTFTKLLPTVVLPDLHNVGVNMVYKEDSLELLNEDVTVHYRKGEDIDAKQAAILGQCQKLIDDYKIARLYYDHAKMDNLVTHCENNIVV